MQGIWLDTSRPSIKIQDKNQEGEKSHPPRCVAYLGSQQQQMFWRFIYRLYFQKIYTYFCNKLLFHLKWLHSFSTYFATKHHPKTMRTATGRTCDVRRVNDIPNLWQQWTFNCLGPVIKHLKTGSHHKETKSAVQLQCLKQRKTLLKVRVTWKGILTDGHSAPEFEWEEASCEWVIGKRQFGQAH